MSARRCIRPAATNSLSTNCCNPTAQANPPLPLPATLDALVPPCKPPQRKAQTSPPTPLPYENYNRYTSSDRTVLERRSPNVSLPQNSSIFTLQLRPSHWPPSRANLADPKPANSPKPNFAIKPRYSRSYHAPRRSAPDPKLSFRPLFLTTQAIRLVLIWSTVCACQCL